MKILCFLLLFFEGTVFLNIVQFEEGSKIFKQIDVSTISFRASEKYLDRIKENNTYQYEKIVERYWILRGDTIKYGQSAKEFQVIDEKIDTIYFWEDLDDQVADTILCLIDAGGKYEFIYNSCCGGFNVLDSDAGQFTRSSINFQLVEESSHQYLGRVDEIGRKIEVLDSVVMPITCRSAMSPNIYTVVVEKINEKTIEDSDKNNIMCYYKGQNYPDSIKYQYDYDYTLISKEIEFKFLPLNSDVLIVEINPLNSDYKLRVR